MKYWVSEAGLVEPDGVLALGQGADHVSPAFFGDRAPDGALEPVQRAHEDSPDSGAPVARLETTPEIAPPDCRLALIALVVSPSLTVTGVGVSAKAETPL